MADLDDAHQEMMTEFGIDQFLNNKAGIGNECTHWVYAALLEARALDSDRPLHISQSGNPYTWGRRVEPLSALPGDVTQFHSFKNDFFCYLPDGDSSRWFTASKIRGPNHTGMAVVVPKMIQPRTGAFAQLESHIHEAGTAMMSIRANLIFFESFAIALTASQLAAAKASGNWPPNVNTRNFDEMLRDINWLELRRTNGITLAQAAAAIGQINHKKAPKVDGTEMAVIFRVQSSGHLRFYRPQQSAKRLAMNAADFEKEKARLIAMMIRSGRPGEAETKKHELDEFGSDNKKQRIKDHRFDWTFRPAGIPTWAAKLLERMAK